MRGCDLNRQRHQSYSLCRIHLQSITMVDSKIILAFLLLGFATILFISVIILAMYIQQLRGSVAVLVRPGGYSNPANAIELRPKESTTPQPRPISGTCPWMKTSMESVVLVPSRRESPKDVFLKDESLFVVNTTACETFGKSTGNNN
ncbi:uncharacterized protein LOC144657783 isoform X5 [Oculina patagonica]